MLLTTVTILGISSDLQKTEVSSQVVGSPTINTDLGNNNQSVQITAQPAISAQGTA